MKIFDEIDVDFKSLGFKETKVQDVILGSLDVNEDTENFKSGKYRIVSCHNLYLHRSYREQVTKNIKNILREFLRLHKIKKGDTVLVCGLGNEDIVADSLGVLTCKKILATNNLTFQAKKHNVCTICPNVQAVTGIKTFDIVNGIAKSIGANLIILIDSLLTENIKRLGHSFQLSSVGMIPGGAMGNVDMISQQTIGIPCISIGVPMMLDLKGVASNIKKSIVVAPKDIKYLVKSCSTILSDAINSVVCASLTKAQFSETKTPF